MSNYFPNGRLLCLNGIFDWWSGNRVLRLVNALLQLMRQSYMQQTGVGAPWRWALAISLWGDDGVLFGGDDVEQGSVIAAQDDEAGRLSFTGHFRSSSSVGRRNGRYRLQVHYSERLVDLWWVVKSHYSSTFKKNILLAFILIII